MFPPDLFTVITPPVTFHLAGVLSLFVTHSSMFLPSNSTIASEGGASMQAGPGVTTLGTGSQISVSSGFGAGVCAKTGAATAIAAAQATRLKNGMRVMK